MEKLSELSKPVAWTSARSLDVRRKITAFTDVESAAEYASANCWEKIVPLYSQEYVYALLAELEAKDKRIAELERANKSQDDHINQQQDRIESLEKTNTELGQRLGAAEKRIIELDYLRLSACEVFKEIGNELGCNPDNESIMMAIDDLKKDNAALRDQRAGLVQAASELGAKLATPVQLQNCDFESVAIMAHWCTDEQLKAWVKGVEHAKKQIRAAGFKVEGDE